MQVLITYFLLLFVTFASAVTPTITPTESPTITPTKSPTTFPTYKQIAVDSQSIVRVEVTQTLNGISLADVDLSAAAVFKSAVARVLASYSIRDYDISIESYKDLRRRLYEYNESALANSMEVSYEISFGAQRAGFSDTSSAASAIISTLTAAVQSSIFNDAIAIEAAAVYGSSVMISVTSGNTITARDASNDFQNSLNDLVEAYRNYQIFVAVAVILSIFLFFCFCWCTVFIAVHNRCPRLGRPVLNPCSKEFEKASTTDTDAVEITIVSKDFVNKEEDWKEAVDTQGRKYYYNSITRESRWEKATNLRTTDKEEWKEAWDTQGRKYYYNSITRESRWEKPKK